MKKLFQISICLSLLTLLAYTPQRKKEGAILAKKNIIKIDSIDLKLIEVLKLDSELVQKSLIIKKHNQIISKQIAILKTIPKNEINKYALESGK